MKTHQLTFVRLGRFEIDVMASVTASVHPRFETEEMLLEQLNRALTLWMETTEEGREAWEDASEDFNIGDLAQHIESPILQGILMEAGIFNLDIVIDGGAYLSYDKVLASPEFAEEAL